ncbi:Inactive phospholipase C-like protein 2 [Bonamia ostreae]|uniref:Phosphoinositide phospholipase C n=1 Tax=Bonamia ostreae TaxID=126728 RepID=A0ABV2AEV0_9EUKA
MADVLLSAFGDKIFSAEDFEKLSEFPSPNFLKEKILIKSKINEDEHVLSKQSKLGKLCCLVPAHFSGYEEENYRLNQVISMPFSKFKKVSENNIDLMRKLTRRNLVRVYPDGQNINSGNFNPAFVWANGAQIAALNYQTAGKFMGLNQGNFFVNGFCGYVIKSAILLNDQKPTEKIRSLNMEIISAAYLPKIETEIVDPYVVVELFGLNHV